MNEEHALLAAAELKVKTLLRQKFEQESRLSACHKALQIALTENAKLRARRDA